MRKYLIIGLMLVSCAMQVGCFVPIWSPNRNTRAKQLINQSESMRHVDEIWERIWGLDTPDFATPYRVHGGVI